MSVRGRGGWSKSPGFVPTALLWLIALLSIALLAFTLNSALRDATDFNRDIFGLAVPPDLQNFADAWRIGNMPWSFVNSVAYTSASVVLLLAIAFLAGFALSTIRFPGRMLMFLLIVGSILVPFQVIMAPFFLTLRDLGLLNNPVGLVLANVAFGLPFTTFVIAAYLRGIPREIYEAAVVDGAATRHLVWRIAAPLAVPILAVVGILNAIWMWNELLLPILLLSDKEQLPMVVALSLAQGIGLEGDPTQASAVAILGMVPMLIVFIVGHRYVVQGISLGHGK